MGMLAPDITTPVRLQLSEAEAKREALGRTLGVVGAVTGVVGAVMVLTANPAIKAALSKGGAVDLTVQPAEAKREALGKSLALIGTAVGVTGSVMTMTANPKLWNKVPLFLRNRPSVVAGVAGVVLAGAVYYLIRAQNQSMMGSRYQAA